MVTLSAFRGLVLSLLYGGLILLKEIERAARAKDDALASSRNFQSTLITDSKD